MMCAGSQFAFLNVVLKCLYRDIMGEEGVRCVHEIGVLVSLYITQVVVCTRVKYQE